MKIKDIANLIEAFAPLSLQESYDNAGLIIGDSDALASGALITLDITDDVIDEAIRSGFNLIVAHHPLIFKGLKKIGTKDMIGRLVTKCIKNDIAVYAAHTNLDNIKTGVNRIICDKLGLKEAGILSAKENQLKKLAVFCPEKHAPIVREAIFKAGAGHIGNYDNCSFNTPGSGTFRALEGANPFVGKIDNLHFEDEIRMEFIFPHFHQKAIVAAMLQAHPYEEVAYDIYPLENKFADIGAGMIGELNEPEDTLKFMARLKRTFNPGCIRHTAIIKDHVKKIAVCGGSGSFLIPAAINAGADIFISGDIKYHEFFDADGRIIFADIGHYESEQFTKELLMNLIKKNFSTFAVQISGVNTNPIKYL
ncbi:MAG: Nif3-like dinuclear metal center hexameric protein [Bacteroidales bacterium]|nr:Nif3-like dinuclear metal center hexameric protein [Bacteroidales bacterium]